MSKKTNCLIHRNFLRKTLTQKEQIQTKNVLPTTRYKMKRLQFESRNFTISILFNKKIKRSIILEMKVGKKMCTLFLYVSSANSRDITKVVHTYRRGAGKCEWNSFSTLHFLNPPFHASPCVL